MDDTNGYDITPSKPPTDKISVSKDLSKPPTKDHST